MNKTMICILLDRSGSMSGRESDVVGGVNAFIAEQKKLDQPATIAIARFDSEGVERFIQMQDLKTCREMVAEDFQPRGGTPLLDAVGRTLVTMDADWSHHKPDNAILVIVTDGQENDSREYTKAKIKEMITAREASGKWGVIYLGANVDAFHEAGSMGIRLNNAAGYQNTAKGIHAAYAHTSASVASMRATGSMDAGLGRNIAEDDVVEKAEAQAHAQAAGWVPPESAKTKPAWAPPA